MVGEYSVCPHCGQEGFKRGICGICGYKERQDKWYIQKESTGDSEPRD